MFATIDTVNHDVITLRQKLGLSQTRFARTYRIPLTTLRNWEQGLRKPDTTSLSYLRVINEIPHHVATALSHTAHTTK
jgi:putative transcriptional regulator